MKDFEKEILEKTKEGNGLAPTEEQKIIDSELEDVDKAAIKAIAVFRQELKDKNQEGVALWRFIRYLTEIEMPMRIVDFSGLLYPNNEQYYDKVITPTAFQMIQRQATLMVANNKFENEEHKKWLEEIAQGKLPYGYSILTEKGKEN